jgi:hypothetical protein
MIFQYHFFVAAEFLISLERLSVVRYDVATAETIWRYIYRHY